MADDRVGGLWLATAMGPMPIEVASTRATRRRGLLGRDHLDGGFLLPRTRSVHTVGMRFPIDVALLDRDGVVLAVLTLAPGRLTRSRRRVRSVLEAEAGCFAHWRLVVGDLVRLSDRPDDARPGRSDQVSRPSTPGRPSGAPR